MYIALPAVAREITHAHYGCGTNIHTPSNNQ